MLTKIRLNAAALALAAIVSAEASADVVRIVKGAATLSVADEGRVLFRHGGAAVVRDEAARAEDFRDVYAVNTYNHFATPAFFDDFGELLAFDPGNFAVMRVDDQGLAELSGHLHRMGLACGVLTRLDGQPMAKEVRETPTPILPIDATDERVQQAAALVDAARIETTIRELAAMTTRYHQSETGRGVADWLVAKYVALKGDRTDVTVTTYDHGSATPQKSLVVRIEGATRPSEVLVLGSHIDSINMPWSFLSPTYVSPGADDNASGTATNLEIFRALMEQGVRLNRTLEIHGYGAEEIGLVGSADMAGDYKQQGVDVVAMVQMDMTSYKAAGSPDQIWFITDDTDPAFNDQLATLVTSYTGMASDRASLPQGSSDHASWRRQGYATSFPFENPGAHNNHIHTSNDTLGNATAFTLAAGFAKLGIAFAMHFGGVQ